MSCAELVIMSHLASPNKDNYIIIIIIIDGRRLDISTTNM